jgi:hypothetical protein
MATFNLARSDLFPVGTVVGLYPRLARRNSDAGFSGTPAATATVNSAGVAAFTVTDNVPQHAAAFLNGQWVSSFIMSSAHVAPATWKATVAARRTAIGTS